MGDENTTQYSCKMCRTRLFKTENICKHEEGKGTKKDFKSKGGQKDAATGCSMYWVEQMKWMGSMSDTDPELEGKINCPKCNTGLGRYSFIGMQCSCGVWVDPPAFQIVKSKIDVIHPIQQIITTMPTTTTTTTTGNATTTANDSFSSPTTANDANNTDAAASASSSSSERTQTRVVASGGGQQRVLIIPRDEELEEEDDNVANDDDDKKKKKKKKAPKVVRKSNLSTFRNKNFALSVKEQKALAKKVEVESTVAPQQQE